MGRMGLAAEPARFTYEGDVRPLLRTHCFLCHGEGTAEGELDLRMRRLMVAGGESGPAIVPGRADGSLLVQRIMAGEMPPEDIKLRLTADETTTIRLWIAAGAPTARPEPEDLDPDQYITEEERSFWAFRPVRRPALPDGETDRTRTAIDRFVARRLAAQGLDFAADADRVTWIRRATFDLWGIPPTPEAVDAFVADQSPAAYPRLIDRLLASPRYGERWARHWLDVVGYADSEGYTDVDPVRPDAFRYRDYVIRSLSANKPIDRFFREQLAGDEMIRPPYGELGSDDLDALIATGLLRMAPDGTAVGGNNTTIARNDTIAKSLEIVSTALLGLTLQCAQCHDHRYDPISQRDYYRFRAIFEPAFHPGKWQTPPQRRISLYTGADRKKAAAIEARAKEIEKQRTAKQQELIAATFERELAKLDADLREPIRVARATPPAKQTAEQKALLKKFPSVNVSAGSLYLYDRKAADALAALAKQAAGIRATKPKEDFVRALTEPAGVELPPTVVFVRGDPEQPKGELGPAGLPILGSPTLQPDVPTLPGSGRRTSWATWLTSGGHPLVGRVYVNRIWMRYFERGIVSTPGDFGRLGTRPTHPELLDWLADDFVRHGWDLKRLHRQIMMSTVYRQSSQGGERSGTVDAENRWLSRMPVRRLEAEVLRDSVLAAGRLLDHEALGPAVPVMADRDGKFVIGIENLNAGRPGKVIPMHGQEFRRSIYIQVRRSRPLGMLATFDAPVMAPNCTRRNASTVAPQALMMMNSPFIVKVARAVARRVGRESDHDVQRAIQRAWKLVYSRDPSKGELQEALDYVDRQAKWFQEKAKKESHDARSLALTSLCQALMSSNEFLYVD